MKYLDRLTNQTVTTERQLPASRYDKLHEDEDCWCEPVSEWVCHCDRIFTTEQGLAQHQRMVHDDESEEE